ncbi:MAG: hypothetical protein V2J25_02995 [Desulfatiglans sp.]|jgi:hypothetical protein|nr:hypothetical protein [Desulfatiglans sp.]
MLGRGLNRLKFELERIVLGGTRYQLLIIAMLICLVSLIAGLLAFSFTNTFKDYGESAWWAFLRLSDPGYLGDDKGVFLQTVSTIVTILGYVLFMGALIAIMIQWLQATMRKLESGLTPLTLNDHVLILGWTNRTATVVRELVLSEGRVKRFLKRIGARKLHIVILAEEVTTALPLELKEELGSNWSRRQITFRSGSPLRLDHLKRVDFMHASVIILPGSDFAAEGSEITDTRTVKSLLTISNYGLSQDTAESPPVVTELIDARKIPIAQAAYKKNIEVIASDRVISRLMAQNVRHSGLSYVYSELLSHNEGNEIYIRECPRLEGRQIHDLTDAFPRAILLGLLRYQKGRLHPLLNPPEGSTLEVNDRLVFLARKHAETDPVENSFRKGSKRNHRPVIREENSERSVLILGWNHKMPALIQEFDSYENEHYHIDLLSLIPITQREEYMSRHNSHQKGVTLRHLEGDYTSPSDLERINPKQYDNIVFLANSWLVSNEESDARTILGYHILKEILPESTSKPEILVELMDPENEKLFQHRTGEVIISPYILSHILAHVALRRELNVVFEELFTAGGAEICFRPASFFGFTKYQMSFKEIREFVSKKGDIALGIRDKSRSTERTGGIYLNPPGDLQVNLDDSILLVVLTTYLDYKKGNQ